MNQRNGMNGFNEMVCCQRNEREEPNEPEERNIPSAV